MTVRERIGKRIVNLRTEKNMTQVQLAELADITRSHLSRIESGKYAVSLDLLDRIATALETRIELVKHPRWPEDVNI